MRARLEGAALDHVTHGQRGQHDLAVGQLGVRVVLALDVGPQEPGEGDDPAAGRELGLLGPVRADRAARAPRPTRRTWALVPVASFIWEATVRFQISS